MAKRRKARMSAALDAMIGPEAEDVAQVPAQDVAQVPAQDIAQDVAKHAPQAPEDVAQKIAQVPAQGAAQTPAQAYTHAPAQDIAQVPAPAAREKWVRFHFWGPKRLKVWMQRKAEERGIPEAELLRHALEWYVTQGPLAGDAGKKEGSDA